MRAGWGEGVCLQALKEGIETEKRSPSSSLHPQPWISEVIGVMSAAGHGFQGCAVINLVYWGTGNAFNTGAERRLASMRAGEHLDAAGIAPDQGLEKGGLLLLMNPCFERMHMLPFKSMKNRCCHVAQPSLDCWHTVAI